MLIHIGYHKTATTWLQKEIFSHKDKGFYPLQPRDGDPRPQPKVMAKPFFCIHDLDFDAAYVQNKVRERCDIEDGIIPVISNERLSGEPFFGGDDSRRIAEKLHATFPEAKILIGIREQISMIESFYHQYIVEGGTLSLKNFLNLSRPRRPCQFKIENFEYDKLIHLYQSLFGIENVMVFAYEELRNDPKDILRRLSNFLGIKSIDYEQSRRVNVNDYKWLNYYTRFLNIFFLKTTFNGFSALALPLHRNHSIYALTKVRQALSVLVPEKLEQSFRKKQKNQIQKFVGDFYGPSNERTQNLTGLNLRDLGYKVSEEQSD